MGLGAKHISLGSTSRAHPLAADRDQVITTNPGPPPLLYPAPAAFCFALHTHTHEYNPIESPKHQVDLFLFLLLSRFGTQVCVVFAFFVVAMHVACVCVCKKDFVLKTIYGYLRHRYAFTFSLPYTSSFRLPSLLLSPLDALLYLSAWL